MQRLLWPIAAFLAATVLITLGVWWWALGSALDQLATRAQTELSLATSRLKSYQQRYRQLAVVLADHPGLEALAQGGGDASAVAALLQAAADKTGSRAVFVLSADGRLLAASDPGWAAQASNSEAWFHRAHNGALGRAQVYLDGARMFFMAAPISLPRHKPVGVLVVAAGVEPVESDLAANPNALFFTDANGVVFVTNRSEFLLADAGQAADTGKARSAADFPAGVTRPLPTHGQLHRHGHTIWTFAEGAVFSGWALHLGQPAPVLDLEAEILVDAGPARLSAFYQAALAGATALVFGAVLLILTERRMALTARLAIEAAANQRLEQRVALRTEQLSGVNLDLRQQIRERREAEEALRRAQQDLVQAGKLSALGQMSAGISHELNQPLMAIRSFAENAETFLERGDLDTTRGNLARISDLARRMGRIIRNLNAFARKEGEPMTDVDLVAVVAAALELSEKQLENAGVAVEWLAPEGRVMVRGGEVRLQQVLMNLLSNAADAMEDSAEKVVTIAIDESDATTRLSVRDTGPGLDEPERVFDPFYSTKAVGRAEGMGLGLSISYGIVQSFGGRIAGRNLPGGGAEFTVELTPVALEDAA
ncbi:MAG: sensor histidine kinase [Rhodobacteraceae bacterium]|nr:sensor histidine kinase [Paracoccaceae bacterium]